MVTLPTVKDTGVPLLSTPKSSVDARDITNLGNAQARMLEGVKDNIEEAASPYAERAGMERVERDEAGNITVAPSLTIGRLADVERKSAMMTFQAQIRSSMQGELQRLSDQTYRPKEEGGGGGDPQWFAEQSKAHIKALANQQRGGYQATVMNEGAIIADQFHRGVQSKRYQIDAHQQKATLEARLGELDNQLVALARANYGGPEFERAAAEYRETLTHMVDDPRFGLTTEAMHAQFGQAVARYKAQSIIGDIERSYDPKNNGSFKLAMDKAERILTDPKLSLTEEQRARYYGRARGAVIEMEGSRKALASVLSGEGRKIAQDIANGIDVPESLKLDYIRRASDVGANEAIDAILGAERQREAYKRFNSMPTSQLARPAMGQSLSVGKATIRDEVVRQANAAGLPGNVVAAIVAQESGFDPTAKNQKSSAYGLFQILGDERAAKGIGDSADPAQQITAGTAKMKENYSAAKNALGREPTPGEFYAVHWQGVGAGAKIISNPDGDFRATLDTVKPGWADKVIAANPNLSGIKTNRDFVRLAGDLVAKNGGGQSIELPSVSGGRPLPASVAKSQAQQAQTAMLAQRQNEVISGQRDVMDDPYMAAIWRNVAKERVGVELPAMIKAMDAYEVPKPEELNALASIAHQIGTPEQKRQVSELAVRADFAAAGRELPAAQMSALIEAKTAEFAQKGTDEQRAAMRKARADYDKVLADFDKDPWTGARKIGIETPSTQTPLDFSNPEALVAGLRSRTLDIEKIRQQRGGEAFGAVVPGEMPSLVNVLAKGDAKQVAGVFAALQTLNDDILFKTLDDPAMKAAISGAARTTDPLKYSAVMSSLDKLESRDADRALRVIDKPVSERLAVWQSNHRYMDDKALMEVLRRDAMMEPQALERRNKTVDAAKSEIYKLDNKELVKKMDDTWAPWNGPNKYRPGDGDTASLLKADYATQYGRFIADGLDDKAAHEQTRKLLSAKWSRSDMNGGVLMPNAPEKEYPQVNGSHDWMQADLGEMVSRAYGSKMPYVIKSDARTMRESESGQKPTYVVLVTKPNGHTEQVMFDGVAKRWNPDPTKSGAYHVAVASVEGDMALAAFRREVANEEWNAARGAVGLPTVIEGKDTKDNQRIASLYNDLQMRQRGLDAAIESFGSDQGGAAQMYRRDISRITAQLEDEAKKGGYSGIDDMIERIKFKGGKK